MKYKYVSMTLQMPSTDASLYAKYIDLQMLSTEDSMSPRPRQTTDAVY